MTHGWWLAAMMAMGTVACAGDGTPSDTGQAGSDEVCEVDLECCAYACQSEAFWSEYNNDCTCDPNSTPGDANRACAYVDGACAFAE